MKTRTLCAALLAAALASCAQLDLRPTYSNPVMGVDFPDPAVVRAPDGRFYAYATNSGAFNIQVAQSTDLVHWTHLGEALPAKPRWAAGKQFVWAPHVLYDAARASYFLYYSVEPDDARGKCLAVASARSPQGPFVDSGAPLLCGQGIEHIDPMAFDDPQTGKRLLYWGSGAQPIRVRELAPDRLGFLPGSTPADVVLPDEAAPYESLIEGAWVVYREGTYYLFYSGDRCCAKAPRYAVMVARGRSATGPFEKLGQPVLERSEAWLAPGHNSAIADDAGTLWMLYHAYDAGRMDRGRLLLIDRIEWRDGWPRVADGRPSSGARPAPDAHYNLRP